MELMNKLRIWLAYYIIPKDTRKHLIKALSDCSKELEREVEEIKKDVEFSYKPINPFQNDRLSKEIVVEMSIIDEETNERVNFVHFVEGKDIYEVAGKINKFISEQKARCILNKNVMGM